MEGAAGPGGPRVEGAVGQHLHRAEEEAEGWQQQMRESLVVGAEAQGEEVGSSGCCWLGWRREEEGGAQGEEGASG